MSKEIYIALLEEKMAALIDQGVPEGEAYEKAGELAYDGLRDRMADMVDRERQRRKDGYYED